MKLLHENLRFKDLLVMIEDERKIDRSLVEKDYWIMHSLWGLQQQGFDFYMKGGTSLSKGYKVIHRFSEDIDILITPPKEMEVKSGKNHAKPIHIESRKRYFDWPVANIKISGVATVNYDPARLTDDKHRNADILLNYPSIVEGKISKLKRGILLEVGFDQVHPFTAKDFSSWADDFAKIAGIECLDNRALKVRCYNPEYTFVEKLSAISTKFRQQQESGEMSRNFLRHYYDVFMLLQRADVQKFIGSEKYHIHKKKRFRKNEQLDFTKNEAFIMSDPQVFAYYEKRYIESRGIYYQEQPPFKNIIDKLREHLEIL